MDKFGLFDIFTKLTQDKNVKNLLSSTLNSLFSQNFSKPKVEMPTKQSPNATKPNKYSQEAILNLLKRHDEISKNIDINTVKPPND